MTRDQALGLALIAAALVGTPILIWIGLARDTLRHADARCGLDGEESWDRMPGPTKLPYVRGIPQADRYPDDAACGPCACGPCALHADREADWQAWEREVQR